MKTHSRQNSASQPKKRNPGQAQSRDQKKPRTVDAMQVFRHEYNQQARMLAGDGFENFTSRLGVGRGVENVLSDGTYTFNLLTRNRAKLEAAYRGSWIVGSIIDLKAEDMTRAGIDIDTTDAKDETSDVLAAMTKLKVWASLCDNHKWGDLYGGSIGVIQIEGQDMATPLRLETIGKGQFKGVVVYDRWQVNPILNDLIQDGPDMGLPRMYQIVSSSTQVMPSGEGMTGEKIMKGVQNVHHSRCIRSIGIKLPFWQAITEMQWGESVLERLWDRLISFDDTTMNCANLVQRANLRTIGIENLREVISNGGVMYDALIAQYEMMREMQVNDGLTVLDKNDTFASTAYTFSGLADMLLQFGQQLSGASNIPLVRLFGQSPAGLSATGESDMRNYYDGINAKQVLAFTNPVDLLLRVLWRSVHGKAAPKDLKFTFKTLWQTTATEKATNAKTNAETTLGAYEAGVTKRSTTLKELRTAGSETGTFQHITDQDIEEADDELDPPPGEDVPEVDPLTGKPKLKVLPGGAGFDPAAPDPATDPATTPVKSLGDAKPSKLTARIATVVASLALALSTLGCATGGDVWDDKHVLQAYNDERETAELKRAQCETGLIELWTNFKKSDPTDKEIKVIQKICKDKVPIPKAPYMCRTDE